MNFAVICKGSQIIKILKFFIFISLAAIFYIFYFTDVLNKFAERDTTLIYTQETIEENERDSPFITFCMTPRAKNSILDGYNLSRGVLNEPNSVDKQILTKRWRLCSGKPHSNLIEIFIFPSICGFMWMNVGGKNLQAK